LRLERTGVGADRPEGQPEAQTEAACCNEQHRECGGVAPHAVAHDQQRHGHRVGEQSDHQHPLETDAAGERRKGQRTGDSEDHLRQEEEPVLARGEVVRRGTGEDGCGRRYGDEAEPLEEPGRVYRDDLGPTWSRRGHRPSPLDLVEPAAHHVYDATSASSSPDRDERRSDHPLGVMTAERSGGCNAETRRARERSMSDAAVLQGPIRTAIPARLDRLGWSPFHTRMVAGLGAAWILDGLQITIASSVTGVLTQPSTLDMTSTEVGLIASVYLVGQLIGALVFGRMSDQLGRKRLLITTLLLYLLGTGLAAFVTGHHTGWLVFFYATRLIAGMGIGGQYAAINSAIDEMMPSKYRGRVDIWINGTY
jgi:Sugar (and other) transporter